MRRQLARRASAAGWSVRETERRARGLDETGPASTGRQVVVHPDLQEALAAAEDALTAALGREVRVRAKGDRCRAEIDFETPAQAVELAERMLARNGRAAA